MRVTAAAFVPTAAGALAARPAAAAARGAAASGAPPPPPARLLSAGRWGVARAVTASDIPGGASRPRAVAPMASAAPAAAASPPTPVVTVGADGGVVGDTLGTRVVAAAGVAVAARGVFRLAVSGGSLPKTLAAGLEGAKGQDVRWWGARFAGQRCAGWGRWGVSRALAGY